MKCDLCEKEATVFLTEIVDGKMRKINLCEACARENEVEDPTGFALADVLLGMSKNQQSGGGEGEKTVNRCPACGFTRKDLERTGRLGCSVCYESFSDEIVAILKRLHKGMKHSGKKAEKITYPTGSTSPEEFPEEQTLEEEEAGDAESLSGQPERELLDLPENLDDKEESGAENAQQPEESTADFEQQLEKHRAELEKAVEAEEYEKAAELRDVIKDLEKKSGEEKA